MANEVRGKRLFVDAVAEIVDRKSGEIVGIKYRWNNGDTRLVWWQGKVRDYELRPLDDVDL
jgi:hypothetical protein